MIWNNFTERSFGSANCVDTNQVHWWKNLCASFSKPKLCGMLYQYHSNPRHMMRASQRQHFCKMQSWMWQRVSGTSLLTQPSPGCSLLTRAFLIYLGGAWIKRVLILFATRLDFRSKTDCAKQLLHVLTNIFICTRESFQVLSLECEQIGCWMSG